MDIPLKGQISGILKLFGMWGLLTGFIKVIGALTLHKVIFFGGRGIKGSQTPEIPPDEHLHHKMHKQYEWCRSD